MHENQSPIVTIFPDLSPEEQQEAEESLRRYLDFIIRLYKRIEADPKARAELNALTEKNEVPRMEPGRTFTSEYPKKTR